MKYNSISLSKFLSRYVNLDGVDLSKVTHEQVKQLFPYLKRSSFEYVEKHPEDVCRGVIVMVSDKFHTIPYYVPTLNENLGKLQEFKVEFDEVKIKDEEHYDYASMSVYELRKLLNTKFNSYKNSREARRELESRGIVLTRKYNRNTDGFNKKKIMEDE